MGKYEKQRARYLRQFFKELLGEQCAHCGIGEHVERNNKPVRLTFDCIVPCGDLHHKMDTSSRMCFYRKQLRLNNLQLLCDKCQSEKGDGPDKIKHKQRWKEENEPF